VQIPVSCLNSKSPPLILSLSELRVYIARVAFILRGGGGGGGEFVYFYIKIM
jgi:hypothetical protein